MNIEQTLKERAKEAETTVVSYLPEVTRISENGFGGDGIQCRSRRKKDPTGFDAGSLSYVWRYRGFADRTFYGGNRDDSYVLSCA